MENTAEYFFILLNEGTIDVNGRFKEISEFVEKLTEPLREEYCKNIAARIINDKDALPGNVLFFIEKANDIGLLQRYARFLSENGGASYCYAFQFYMLRSKLQKKIAA